MSEAELKPEPKKSSPLVVLSIVAVFIIILLAAGGGMVYHGVSGYLAQNKNSAADSPPADGVPADAQPAADAPPAEPARPDKKSRPAADTDGNAAVAFHNKLLGFIGTSRAPFKKIDQTIKNSEEFIIRGNSRPDWGRVFGPMENFDKIPVYPFAAPDSFGAADREFFNTRIELVKTNCAALLKLDRELADYYTAENFKDDWHKKFLVAAPKIYALMDAVADADNEMYERSNAITEEIDRRNLAKTPCGVYILNMRHMLDKAKLQGKALLAPELRDTRYGMGVSDAERDEMIARAKPAADQADALARELDGMAEKYAAADREKIKGTNLEREYDAFFKSYAAARPELTRIIRDLREKGYYNDQHNVKSYMEDLIRAHNRFVDILNGK
ncbi:MAG: YiiG family protein [Verrucomicrobiales bacterium]|jgi:hypothetical protein|nr:YiiG family protein [Verrucomicrobiales bacterium]